MAWLRKKAALIEVIVNDPGTKTGVCPECFAKNGKTVSEIGQRPPYHPRCNCRVDTVEKELQPGKVLDENFVGMQPAEYMLEEPEEGGVEEITL